MSNVDEIIAKVWENAPAVYEPLNGGYVNFTYKVQVNGQYFALRINGKQNDHLGLSSLEEIEAIRIAGEMEIAPRVLPQSTSTYLITEFIDAHLLKHEEICHPSMICNAVEVLKKIHRIQGVDRKFSPFDLVNKHLEGMKSLGVSFPNALDECLREVDVIHKRWENTAQYRKAYCHNDYYTYNILNANGKLYVIDWELSGEGDIFFDLATLSYSNAYTEALDTHLLQCYFGAVEDEYYAALRDMKYMNMLRDATWGLLHAGMEENVINHDLNYLDYGMGVLKRLQEGYLYL